jgi:hypothetical protein
MLCKKLDQVKDGLERSVIKDPLNQFPETHRVIFVMACRFSKEKDMKISRNPLPSASEKEAAVSGASSSVDFELHVVVQKTPELTRNLSEL